MVFLSNLLGMCFFVSLPDPRMEAQFKDRVSNVYFYVVAGTLGLNMLPVLFQMGRDVLR